MDFVDLFDGLGKGHELWWLDTYAPEHKLWIGHLRDAISRGARIRVLALNPDCIIADYRAQEIGDLYTPARFKAELKLFIDDLSACTKTKSTEGGFLELRIYSDLTGIPIYLVRRGKTPTYAYTSFFMGAPSGVDFAHMRWQPSERGLLNDFFGHVERKWNRSGPSVLPASG